MIRFNEPLGPTFYFSMTNNFFFSLFFSSLNTRIVLLIRDPRGALQSRKHRDWCPGRPDCDHPATVCSDMVSDYYSAVELNKKFPHTFRFVIFFFAFFN